MDVKEEDVFQPAFDDVIQDLMLNWVIRGVTLDQSYKEEDYIPIKPERFEGLEQFTFSAATHPEAYPIDVNVYSLEGLQYAKDLKKIDLSYNRVSDLTPLKDLTNLRKLSFYMNKISDISPLENLTNMEELHFAFNTVTNLNAISGMKNLKVLDFANNGLSDITGIEGCINLSSVTLSGNNITDISQMKYLTNMDGFLWLNDNQIKDISALVGMTKLKELDLFNNQISDITALANLRNLEKLNLGNNAEIADITPLVNLTNLNEADVNLTGTKIEVKKSLLFSVINVNKLIERFNANDISIVDKTKVENARRAYEALSDEAKGYVDELRISAAEQNIQRIEQGVEPEQYTELEKYENMAKQNVKRLEIRVTNKDGNPVHHVKYAVKGKNSGSLYKEIVTDKSGVAEYEVPVNINEMDYILELSESDKYTGMTQNISMAIDEEGVITHIGGKATEDGKYDVTLTLKDGIQLSVEKVALKNVISQAEKITADGYTEDSYQNMKTVLDAAKSVLADAAATQAKVDEAEKNLQEAIYELKKGVDYKTLKLNIVDESGQAVPNVIFKITNAWNSSVTEVTSDGDGNLSYTVPDLQLNYYTLKIDPAESYTMTKGEFRFSVQNYKIVEVDGKEVTGPENLKATVVLKKNENQVVDKTKLQNKITEAEAVNTEVYTEESYAALQEAIKQAKVIMNDAEVSQLTVNRQVTALQKAIDALVTKEVKPENTKTIVILAKNANGKPVEGVVFAGISNYGQGLQFVTDSRGAIVYQFRTGESVDFSMTDENYSTETNMFTVRTDWETGEITSVAGNTPTSIDDLIVNVIVNKNGGETPVDKSSLEAKIAEAKEKNPEDYTEETFANLTEALKAAEEVLGSDSVTQVEVDAQIEALDAAIAQLEEKTEMPVDKTPLEKKIPEAKKIEKDGFTASSYEALQEAIKTAEGVLNDSKVTQDAVYKAVLDLQKAIDNLKEIAAGTVDKELLKTRLEEAKAIKADAWTAESYATLQGVIEVAEALIKNDQATQVDVDRMVAQLSKAVNELQEKKPDQPNPDKPDPDKPNPDKPGEGGNTGNQGGTSGNGKTPSNVKPGTGSSVAETGDTTAVLPLTFVMGAAAIAILSLRKKRSR